MDPILQLVVCLGSGYSCLLFALSPHLCFIPVFVVKIDIFIIYLIFYDIRLVALGRFSVD